MRNEDEIYVDIKNCNGYQVSNIGNIRSLDRLVSHNRYKHKLRVMRGRILKQYTKDNGYRTVSLGARSVKYVHRLVAEAFIPNPYSKKEVNHKNGDKSNNAVDNLEWVTHQENQRHAGENNLMARGERVHGAILDENTVLQILKENGKQKDIAIKYGLNRMHIGKIKRREIWKHVKI